MSLKYNSPLDYIQPENYDKNKILDVGLFGDLKDKDNLSALQKMFTSKDDQNNIFKLNLENAKDYEIAVNKIKDSYTSLGETGATQLANIVKADSSCIESQNSFSKAVKTSNRAIQATGTASAAASIGVNLLNAALSAGVALAFSLIISLAVQGINELIHSTENARAKLDEFNNSWTETSNKIKDNTKKFESIKDEFIALSKGVSQNGKNISLTADEYDRFLELSNELYELYPELTHTFDAQGNAIINYKGNVDLLTESINNLQEAEKRAANEDVLKNANDAFKEYNKTVGGGSKFSSAFQASYVAPLGAKNVPYYNDIRMTQYLIAASKDITKQEELAGRPLSNKEQSDIIWFNGAGTADGISSLLNRAGIEASWFESLDSLMDKTKEDLNKGSSSLLTNYFNELEDAIEKETNRIRPVITATVELDDSFMTLSEEQKSTVYNAIDNLDYDFLVKNFGDEYGNIAQEDVTDWITTSLIPAFEDERISKAINESINLENLFKNGDINTEDYVNRLNQVQKAIETIDNTTPEGAASRELLKNTANYETALSRINEIKSATLSEVNNGLEISSQEEAQLAKETSEWINSLSSTDIELVYEILPTGEYTLEELKKELNTLKTEKAITTVTVEVVKSNLANDKTNFKDIVSENIDKFGSAISTVSAGNAISYEDMQNLLSLDSTLLNKFTRTAEGYVIATEDLTNAREKYLANTEMEVQGHLLTAQNTARELTENIVELNKERQNILNDTSLTPEERAEKLISNSEALRLNQESYTETNSAIIENKFLLEEIQNPINTNIEAVNSLSTALESLAGNYNIVNAIQSDFVSLGRASLSNLESLATKFPDLKDEIAEYITSDMSESDNQRLLDAINEAYGNAKNNTADFLGKELETSEEYYDKFLTSNEDRLKTFCEENQLSYDEDLKNYKTYLEAKNALGNLSKNPTFTQQVYNNTSGKTETIQRDISDYYNLDTGEYTDYYYSLHFKTDTTELKEVDEVIRKLQEFNGTYTAQIEIDTDNAEDKLGIKGEEGGLPADIVAYQKELAEIEHRGNMGEDVLGELNAKLAEGANLYQYYGEVYTSDLQATQERIHTMTNEFYSRDKAELDHQLNMKEITHREYFNSLTALYEKYYKGRSGYTEENRQLEEELESQRKSLITEEQSLLAKQKEELIEYETDAYDIQINLLQKKIEENEKISDEISKQNELLEAQKALLEASQRTKYIYKAGQGFVYERDEEAWYDAKKNYQEVLTSQENDRLQGQIEALEKSSEESVNIIQNFFDSLNEVLEEKINPELDNDKAVWSEFFTTDQISALETILGKKDYLEDLSKQNKTVEYGGEVYRYADENAMASLAESYLPKLINDYQSEISAAMKLNTTNKLEKELRGITNNNTTTVNGNSVVIAKDAVKIVIEGNADESTVQKITECVYSAFDEMAEKIELARSQNKGKK